MLTARLSLQTIFAEGDLVTVNIDLVESPQEIPVEYGELTVLYEDDFLLAINPKVCLHIHPVHN